MLTDTHAHLEMKEFGEDLDEVVHRAQENGVSTIITVGSTLESSEEAIKLAEKYECVYAAAGIHPHDAGEADAGTLKALSELLKHPQVVAVGEMGLDYYRDYSPREKQREVFREQLRMARDAGLPIIVHSRQAHSETLLILKEAAPIKGIMHCFSGDRGMAEMCIKMGLLISFAGPLTYPNSRKLQQVASSLHLDNIVVETDSPYLPPQPMRGERNEPANVRHVARKLAELHGLTLEDVARTTTLNAYRLLGVGEIEQEGQLIYRIRDSLYLNVTNRCTNHCEFCMRNFTDYVKGHNLRLQREPAVEELWQAIQSRQGGKGYDEVVFCGYGEPTLRLDVVKELARRLKERGVKTRLDTNGHGNLISGRDILPELRGLIDSVVVSLNAQNAFSYSKLCQPSFKEAYEGVKDFVLKAKEQIPDVSVTVVNVPDEVDVEECRRIAREELGVKFRVREYNVYG